MNNIINNLYKPSCLLQGKLLVLYVWLPISLTPSDQNYFNIELLKIINHNTMRICRYRETDSHYIYQTKKEQICQKRVQCIS